MINTDAIYTDFQAHIFAWKAVFHADILPKACLKNFLQKKVFQTGFLHWSDKRIEIFKQFQSIKYKETVMLDAGDIFKMLGLLFWGSMLLLIWFAVWWAKKLPPKLRKWGIPLAVLAVIGLYGWMIVPGIWKAKQQEKAAKQRYQKAKAIFNERCKSAGEKIYKTVDDVEGIKLLKVRPEYTNADGYNPMWEDAAMDEGGGEDYINNFLEWEFIRRENVEKSVRGLLLAVSKKKFVDGEMYPGYAFVDVLDSESLVKRYRLFQDDSNDEFSSWKMKVTETNPKKQARYAVDYENYVDPEDRKYWIAGTKIKIIDTENNQLIAEKTIYLWSPGWDNDNPGARRPWGYVFRCPEDPQIIWTGARTRFFVDRILKPKQVVQP